MMWSGFGDHLQRLLDAPMFFDDLVSGVLGELLNLGGFLAIVASAVVMVSRTNILLQFHVVGVKKR